MSCWLKTGVFSGQAASDASNRLPITVAILATATDLVEAFQIFRR